MRVWDAVNDISNMIHEIDGNHPTMYVVADYFDPVVSDISNKLADIDSIDVNSCASLGNCLARRDSSNERRAVQRPLAVAQKRYGHRLRHESPAHFKPSVPRIKKSACPAVCSAGRTLSFVAVGRYATGNQQAAGKQWDAGKQQAAGNQQSAGSAVFLRAAGNQ